MSNDLEKNKHKKINLLKKPKQKRSIDKVNRILDSAKYLLVFGGIDKLTTNHIAEHSGITVGSIYQYFPNKESIIYQIYLEMLDVVKVQIKDIRNRARGEHRDINQLIDELLNDIYGLPDIDINEAILDRELNKAMKLFPELQEIESEHSKIVISLLAEIIEDSSFQCGSDKTIQLATFLYSLEASISLFLHLDGDIDNAILWFKSATKSIFTTSTPQSTIHSDYVKTQF